MRSFVVNRLMLVVTVTLVALPVVGTSAVGGAGPSAALTPKWWAPLFTWDPSHMVPRTTAGLGWDGDFGPGPSAGCVIPALNAGFQTNFTNGEFLPPNQTTPIAHPFRIGIHGRRSIPIPGTGLTVRVHFNGHAQVFNNTDSGTKAPGIAMREEVTAKLLRGHQEIHQKVRVRGSLLLDALGPSVASPAVAGYSPITWASSAFGIDGSCPNIKPTGDVIGLRFSIQDPKFGQHDWPHVGIAVMKSQVDSAYASASKFVPTGFPPRSEVNRVRVLRPHLLVAGGFAPPIMSTGSQTTVRVATACPTEVYLCAHWWIPFHTWISSYGSVTLTGGLGWNQHGQNQLSGCVKPVLLPEFVPFKRLSTNFVTRWAQSRKGHWHPHKMGEPVTMRLHGRRSFNVSTIPFSRRRHVHHYRVVVRFAVSATLENHAGRQGIGPYAQIKSSWSTRVFEHGRLMKVKAAIGPGILFSALGVGVSKPAIGALVQQPGTKASSGSAASGVFDAYCPNFTPTGHSAALLFQVGGVQIGNDGWGGYGFNAVAFKHVG